MCRSLDHPKGRIARAVALERRRRDDLLVVAPQDLRFAQGGPGGIWEADIVRWNELIFRLGMRGSIVLDLGELGERLTDVIANVVSIDPLSLEAAFSKL